MRGQFSLSAYLSELLSDPGSGSADQVVALQEKPIISVQSSLIAKHSLAHSSVSRSAGDARRGHSLRTVLNLFAALTLLIWAAISALATDIPSSAQTGS